MGASRLCGLFGAALWRTWEKDCSASDEAGMWSDECGRAAPFSAFSARRTGKIVQGGLCEATRGPGSHGVIATCWTRSLSPFAPAYVSCASIVGTLSHIPALLPFAAGNRSLNRSSESIPTSPFMRSSSNRRAEIGGRSRRLLRRLLRG